MAVNYVDIGAAVDRIIMATRSDDGWDQLDHKFESLRVIDLKRLADAIDRGMDLAVEKEERERIKK